MGTFLVGAILLCAVIAALKSMIQDKKKGKFSCGGDCSRCGGCH